MREFIVDEMQMELAGVVTARPSPEEEAKALKELRNFIEMYHLIYSLKRPDDPSMGIYDPDESLHPFIHSLNLQHANYTRNEVATMVIKANAKSR